MGVIGLIWPRATLIVSSWSTPAPSLAPRTPCYNPPCRETLECEDHLSSWRFRRPFRAVFSADLVPKARKELKLLPLNPGTKSEAKTKKNKIGTEQDPSQLRSLHPSPGKEAQLPLPPITYLSLGQQVGIQHTLKVATLG